MRKRLLVFIMACTLVFVSTPVFACDENQTNTYVTQILFGNSASGKVSNEDVKKLLSALYLCCEQSNKSGQDKVDYLKRHNVSGIPSLSKINIDRKNLLPCSHNKWEDKYPKAKKEQAKRKKVLQKTVNNVFDFGLVNNVFGSGRGQCDSFAAILYYSHILSDYLADDPENTTTIVNGKETAPYSGKPFTTVNGDKPSFTEEQKKNTQSTVELSPLDSLGRAGVAFANIGPDIMPPSNSRQDIGYIHPSGWNQKKYKDIIGTESKAGLLYNRCHLIAHQFIGIDQEINLVTGTDYLNSVGMKSCEDEVAAYLTKTGNHVLYRATPIFKGDNKLVSGVQLEAYSVEDSGEGVCFNRYCYNVQPGINIHYANGENEASDLTVGSKGMIPFAVRNASDANPDLILEMDKHFRVLFEDQTGTMTFKSMENDIKTIANRARSVETDYNNDAQRYIALKNCEYDYLEVLKAYVPKLLKKEDFFNSAFK